MRFSWLVSYQYPGNSVVASCIITTKPIQIGTLRWKRMSNGTGMTVLDENIFAHVKLFILEEEVHRFQEWLEKKLQTYFKRDTEYLNHNAVDDKLYVIIVLCYFFLWWFILYGSSSSICPAFMDSCWSYTCTSRLHQLTCCTSPPKGKP